GGCHVEPPGHKGRLTLDGVEFDLHDFNVTTIKARRSIFVVATKCAPPSPSRDDIATARSRGFGHDPRRRAVNVKGPSALSRENNSGLAQGMRQMSAGNLRQKEKRRILRRVVSGSPDWSE
ncbi:hypothetical protein, partial [Reyranella sp.]|uniref:hypothetical protein n=1 Tax=Reyranella sp. TaxID=1929291 RepID=UPI002F93AFEB